MGRILAIDYGTKRVGLAVTDRMKIIATALTTVHANDLLEYLDNYFQQEEVEEVVIGLPLRMDDTPSSVETHIQGFIKRFKKAFPHIPVEREDERFTSKLSQDALVTGGMKKKKRQHKGQLDQTSAVIILQSYLRHI